MILLHEEARALTVDSCNGLYDRGELVVVALEEAEKKYLLDVEASAAKSRGSYDCLTVNAARLLEDAKQSVPILTADFLPKTILLDPKKMTKEAFCAAMLNLSDEQFYSWSALQTDYQGAFELIFKHSLFYHHAQISNTDFCNLRCRGCAYHGNDPKYGFAKMRSKSNRIHMDPSTYCTYIDQLPEGKDVLFCPSGELFVAPHAMEFVRYACERKLHVRIVTNGMLLNVDICKELVELGVSGVIFSIDGHRADLVEGIRLGVDFEKVLANLRLLIEARDSADSPMAIGVTAGWFKELRPFKDEIVEFWKEFGVDTFAFFEEKLGLFTDDRIHSTSTPLDKSMPCFKTLVTAPLLTNGIIAPCSHHMPIAWSKYDTSWMKSIHDASLDEIHRYYRQMRLDPHSPYRKNCAKCESKYYCYVDEENQSVSVDAYRFTDRRGKGEAAFVKDVSSEKEQHDERTVKKIIDRLWAKLRGR